MELEGLARGDAEGAVGEASGELVVNEVLSGWDDAARLAGAHHHGVFLACFALIAIILLVDAVELDELLIVAAEAIGFSVGQGFADISRKIGFIGLK